ncbi:MliC family protein [Pseudoalteromonas piscicida]|uniref:C-type lysozyme inhibitor domain-containing protein n=1 Tax=Pseudoalteromonas piscicida TaxID=43662 RepID=A0A2A5JTF0_PSEO7|nr:MliC family protein [Pseudoalteromonas piscicida]PCK32752.1 hypothetical protein CEX98_05905 [Pseudoalteromonas piscicida]
MKIIPVAVLMLATLSACSEKSANHHMNLSDKLSNYACDNQSIIKVAYDGDDKATVYLDDKTLAMTITRSASGAKYQGDGFIWWTKNDEGMLLKQAQNKNNRIIARCEMRPNSALVNKAK